MNLLFIECKVDNTNEFDQKIVEYGYTLVNDNFEVLETNSTIFLYDKNIYLENTIVENNTRNTCIFNNTNELFIKLHEKVKNFLKEDTKIFGWDVEKFLYCFNHERIQLHLQKFRYSVFSVQNLYRLLYKKFKVENLLDVCKTVFNLKDNQIKEFNNSQKLSFLCFKLLKFLCFTNQISISELFKEKDFLCCIFDLNTVFEIQKNILDSREEKYKFLNTLNLNRIDRYMFFDIECSNCSQGEGKICEFGQAITSPDFNIFVNKTILINPGKDKKYDFKLLNRKNNKDLHLSHEENDYQAYRNSEEFDIYADDIAFLFNQVNFLYFGFDVINDLNYLDYTFRRYNKKMPDFFAIDIKALYQIFHDDEEGMSLEYLSKKYLFDEQLRNIKFHDSGCDSMVTMFLLKKLLNEQSTTLEEIIKRCGVTCVFRSNLDTKNFKIIKNLPKIKNKMFKYKKKNAFNELIKERKENKIYLSVLNDEKNIGKRFAFSQKLKKYGINLVELTNLIEDKGYFLALETKDIDILLGVDEIDLSRAEKQIKHELIFTTLDDFLKLLNIDGEKYQLEKYKEIFSLGV